MEMNKLSFAAEAIELGRNNPVSKKSKSDIFEIMHMERVVAKLSLNGKAEILEEPFMPYDLYLEEDTENDIDILINNLTRCAT